jgi:cytidylate kinase
MASRDAGSIGYKIYCRKTASPLLSHKTNHFVVTIDGPAGGGKSTAAKNLAAELEFDYLDTGAMYRCAALAAQRENASWDAPERVAEILSRHTIQNRRGRTYLDGVDVSDEIRTPEITELTRYTADNPLVRRQMTLLQRRAAAGRRIVTEGRDQGTEVFPDAPCKFYLTASPEVRAKRRMKEFRARGEVCSFDAILASIIARDERDSHREIGPLRKPDDAIEIDSDHMTSKEVVARMAQIIRKILKNNPS